MRSYERHCRTPHPCRYCGDHKSHRSRIDLSTSHQNIVKVAPTWSNPLSDRYNPSPHPSLASCNATMLAINKCNAMQPQDPPPGLTRHRARWTLGRALCERYRPLWTCAQHTRVAMRWWAGLFPGFGRLGVRAFCTFWALAPYACLWRISRLNVRDCRIDGIGGCV
jgi:hypothetical protein